jgi:hypothetical protein
MLLIGLKVSANSIHLIASSHFNAAYHFRHRALDPTR